MRAPAHGCAIACAALWWACSGKSPPPRPPRAPPTAAASADLCRSPRFRPTERPSAEEIEKLEAIAREGRGDLEVHLRLAVHYGRLQFRDQPARDALDTHLLWMIQNCPGSDAHMFAPPLRASRRLSDAWRRQADLHPTDAQVLANAASFFVLFDQATAHQLYDRAEAADPRNPRWPAAHAHLHKLELHRSPDRAATARKWLAALERAASLSTPEQRFDGLAKLARAAVEVGDLALASKYASEALAGIPAAPRTWNTGNLIHHAHLVLGRVALRSGDLPAAKQHLLEAGKTPGSPQLDSFGPNMQLASELLEKGERQVVLDYFDLCEKFWVSGKPRLDAWRAQIASGAIPDFRANLAY